MDKHDPDDVAAFVEHDAQAGLPGWKRVAPKPERGSHGWAEQVLMSVTRATAAEVNQVLLPVLVATATVIDEAGPDVTTGQVLHSLIETVVGLAYGQGTAEHVHTLLGWWSGLDDEQRAASGALVTD